MTWRFDAFTPIPAWKILLESSADEKHAKLDDKSLQIVEWVSKHSVGFWHLTVISVSANIQQHTFTCSIPTYLILLFQHKFKHGIITHLFYAPKCQLFFIKISSNNSFLFLYVEQSKSEKLRCHAIKAILVRWIYLTTLKYSIKVKKQRLVKHKLIPGLHLRITKFIKHKWLED